jgi:hypothetical protein
MLATSAVRIGNSPVQSKHESKRDGLNHDEDLNRGFKYWGSFCEERADEFLIQIPRSPLLPPKIIWMFDDMFGHIECTGIYPNTIFCSVRSIVVDISRNVFHP